MIIKLTSPKRARLENKTSSPSPRRPWHETALFLNNVGVQFLLQNCYSQAVETFRDAYLLVRGLGYNVSVGDMQVIMCRAFHNITHPRCEESPPLVLEVLETSRGVDDELFLYSADSDDALKHILETAPSSCIAFAIQMRDQSTAFLRQQVAIVEHNLAIAYFCQKTVASSLKEALRFSESAVLAFLDMRQASSSDTQLLSLTMAILNSNLHLLQESNNEDKMLQCYDILVKCRDAACETMERLEHLPYSP